MWNTGRVQLLDAESSTLNVWRLLLLAVGHAGAYTLGRQKGEHMRKLVEQGILNKTHVDWIDCKGTAWDEFRSMYSRHIENGDWNWADEDAWAGRLQNWRLSKAAEALLETWRTYRLTAAERNLSGELGDELVRDTVETPYSVLEKQEVARMVVSHLNRAAYPDKWTMEDFGSACLPGLIAAITVFARTLSAIERRTEPTGPNDGFNLWRIEMGYILSGFMYHEGAMVLDLFAAPGWPGVTSELVESVLHRRKVGEEATVGAPQLLPEVRPKRLPPLERYASATDPMGVTNWGQRAATWMAYRAQAILYTFNARAVPPWAQIGPAWVPVHASTKQRALKGPSKVRLTALISQHGALDIEIPELLRHLFPGRVEPKYVLGGDRPEALCQKTEGSAVMAEHCADLSETQNRRAWSQKEARENLAGERWLLDPLDPRLYFLGDGLDPTGRRRPDIFTMSSWLEAIWVMQEFPGIPLVLFFGPPVFIHPAEDMVQGRHAAVSRYWDDIEKLIGCTLAGDCLVAAESLFRAEQFFYQSGTEVPFLRPMSVWVNATYNPRVQIEGPVAHGRVLVHNRGRLKYEMHFINMIQLLAGPTFSHEILAQEGRTIPFAELANFYAIVVVPWSPELCMLRHLFKMRVPLFVPEKSLLRNMVHVANQRLIPYPYNMPMPNSDRVAITAEHPYDPFLDTVRWPQEVGSLESRMYWAEYSEYLLLPFLQHFASGADLIQRLHVFEPMKVSSQMQHAYMADLEEMRSFWEDAMLDLLKVT